MAMPEAYWLYRRDAPDARTSARRSAPDRPAATTPAGLGSRELTRRRLVPHEAEKIAERTLRHAAAEMRAKRPEHRADGFDRMVALDRQAAHDDDPTALLDLFEHPLEIAVERGVAAVFRADLAERQPSLADPLPVG
jgi:hypothetical protein